MAEDTDQTRDSYDIHFLCGHEIYRKNKVLGHLMGLSLCPSDKREITIMPLVNGVNPVSCKVTLTAGNAFDIGTALLNMGNPAQFSSAGLAEYVDKKLHLNSQVLLRIIKANIHQLTTADRADLIQLLSEVDDDIYTAIL